MEPRRVVSRDGQEGILILTSAAGANPRENLCLVHLYDANGDLLPGHKQPLCGPLPHREAVEAAEQWAAKNGWRRKQDETI